MAENRQSTQFVPKHEHHGNSVAAWTAVTIIMIGFLVATFAWAQQSVQLYIIGGAVIIVGVIVGKVLQGMGFGVKHD